MTVAALYVATGGVYYGLPDVDPWDEARDARLYAGPHPVVAHPPCERWGRYWSGGPNPRARRRIKGDDGGCFAAALASVRKWGGVLEHPAGSHAWAAFGLPNPSVASHRVPTWTCDIFDGWATCVEQGAYGHAARKSTWLYVIGADLPRLRGPVTDRKRRLDEGFHSSEERCAARARRLSPAENLATPIPFRDLLLSIARSAGQQRSAA